MRKILTVTFLSVMSCVPALADQITLKNGDRLTGKIVKSDGGKLVIKTQLVGDVTVDLAVVTNITTDEPLYVTLADGRTVSGVMTVADAKAELRGANANALSFNRSDIQVIRSEEEQLARFIWRDQARQKVSATPVRMKSDFRERLAERRSVRSDAQITREREIASRARSWTIDRRDHRLRHLPNRENHATPCAEYARELFRVTSLHQLSHEADVAAGAKRTAGAGDNNHTHIAITARVFERFRQVATHVTDECVQTIRTTQRDRRDAVSFCDLNVLVHLSPLKLRFALVHVSIEPLFRVFGLEELLL